MNDIKSFMSIYMVARANTEMRIAQMTLNWQAPLLAMMAAAQMRLEEERSIPQPLENAIGDNYESNTFA